MKMNFPSPSFFRLMGYHHFGQYRFIILIKGKRITNHVRYFRSFSVNLSYAV